MADQAARILLLEDEALIGALLTDVLESFGFRNVTHVMTVEAAIAELALDDVDLCICDLSLGQTTCAAAVAEANARKLPVILMSGYSDISHLETVPDRYIFLEKPPEPDHLETAVNQLLGR